MRYIGAKRNTNDMIKTCSKYFLICILLIKINRIMKTAVYENYKPMDALGASGIMSDLPHG